MCQQCHHSVHCCADLRSVQKAPRDSKTCGEDGAVNLLSVVTPSCPGLVVVAVIIGSRKVGINPDNVATPIAASLGDLVTLYLLARISSMFFCHRGQKLRYLMCVKALIVCWNATIMQLWGRRYRVTDVWFSWLNVYSNHILAAMASESEIC